jgi:hypothetical protein
MLSKASQPQLYEKPMHLEIILCTYDHESVHPRRFDKPKRDIVWRSVRSLMTAIKNAPDRYDINLVVLDDRSTDATQDFLRWETAFLGDKVSIETLSGTGNNASMLERLQRGKVSNADLVYIVEDDYLHYPDALAVALDTWEKFYPLNPLPLMGMSLVDCASNYRFDKYGRNDRKGDGSIAHIIGGTDRPWRTISHTGVTFLLEKGVLQNHWQPFEEIGYYWPYFEEEVTFNKLWNTSVGMYCPLVPLAYHLWEDHPYYPVKDLWEDSNPTDLKLVSAGV